MSKFINWLQRANILLAIAQGLSVASGAFPGLAGNPYVLTAQAILGVLLPSVDGIGHKLVHGEHQDPAKR